MNNPTERLPIWTLGDRLRKAREVAGVSTQQMADLLEVSPGTVRNYEAGRTPVKRPTLVSWALRCGVPVVWLQTGERPKDHDGGPGGDSGQVTDMSTWMSRRHHQASTNLLAATA